MNKEAVFGFAREKGWYQVLDMSRETHDLSEIAKNLNKKEILLQIELRVMCSLGLVQLVQKPGNKYSYVTTVLGVKFLQEENLKRGLTYTCQLCGTTTGQPHICPEFYPEFR